MQQIVSQRMLILKNFRGGTPPDPTRKLTAFGYSARLLQTINLRQNLLLACIEMNSNFYDILELESAIKLKNYVEEKRNFSNAPIRTNTETR